MHKALVNFLFKPPFNFCELRQKIFREVVGATAAVDLASFVNLRTTASFVTEATKMIVCLLI